MLAEIASGKEAVAAVSQLRPDGMLMEIKLSGEIDGIDAPLALIGSFLKALRVHSKGLKVDSIPMGGSVGYHQPASL